MHRDCDKELLNSAEIQKLIITSADMEAPHHRYVEICTGPTVSGAQYI